MNDTHTRMKIAFLTSFDPLDRRSWSGTVYYLAQALEKHCGEVSYLGPMKVREKTLGKIINKCARLFLKKGFEYNANLFVAKKYAKIAAQKLAQQDFDVVITVAGSPEIAFLKTDIPIVLIEDATFAILHNYYPQFTNLLKLSIHQTNMTEALAIANANMLIYPSEWGAHSAIETYHANERNVHVIPLGANLEIPPPKEIAFGKKKSERCKLLFVGVDWLRKGGEIAFETLLKLEEMGIQAELTVCGCTPPAAFSHRSMKVIPFLDKNDPIQRKELENLYMASDFLLLPTRKECFGIVCCEANAFGLPAITTNTGGVAGVIQDGENGFMLPFSARGTAYAETIAKIFQDEQLYAALVQSSRAAFDDRLNWDAWGSRVKMLLDEMLAARRN